MKLVFSLCMCMMISVIGLRAQVPTYSENDVLTDIPAIICPIGDGVHHHEVHAPKHYKNFKGKQSVIIPAYAASMPVEAIRAIDSVLIPLVSKTFPSDIPIHISFGWEQQQGSLAAAQPSDFRRNFINDIKIFNTWYAIALAEKIAGEEFNEPGEADVIVNINSGADWCFDCTSSEEVGNRFDFVGTLLHEVYHGLGFSPLVNVAADGTGSILAAGTPSNYSFYLEDSDGVKAISAAEGTRELGDILTSGDLFFASGTSEDAKIFAPDPYQAGSSISHLDQSTFQASESSLMVPSAFRGTFERAGGLADSILYDMGWNYTRLLHELSDFSIENPVDEDFVVKLEVKSDAGIVEDSLRLHYSFDEFVTEDVVVEFQRTGENQYEALIPAPGESAVVGYFIEVRDNRGERFSNPGINVNGIQFINTYAFGPDDIDPELTHEPTTSINSVDLNLTLFANSTDDFAGLDTILIEWRLNDVDQETAGMVRDTVNLFQDDLYVGTINFPRALSETDKLEYRVVAIDGSSKRNETASPTEGYHQVAIIPLNAPASEYINDFNSETDDFDFNEFSITQPAGFADPAIHSLHPYPEAGANSTVDFTAELKTPIILKETGEATMIFDEIVLVEPSEPGAVFGDLEFWDYVIVEGKKLGSNEWLPFLDGYDSRANPTWNGVYNNGIAVGAQNSTRNGEVSHFRTRTLDLLESGNFESQDTVFMRFRLFSDPAARGWGWAIDNLQIQDVISAVEDFIVKEDFRVFPNPATESITVSLDLISTTDLVSIKVQDILGRTVQSRSLTKPSRSISEEFSLAGLDNGVYLIEVSFNDRDKISQKILKQ